VLLEKGVLLDSRKKAMDALQKVLFRLKPYFIEKIEFQVLKQI